VEKESGLDQVVHSVEYDSFHDLPVLELKLDPDSVDHRGIREEFEVVPGPLAFEAFYEEDSLEAIDGDFAECVVFCATQAQDFGKAAEALDEQSFQFLPLLGFDVTLENPPAGLNDDLVELDL
jgi:hypothetical protein